MFEPTKIDMLTAIAEGNAYQETNAAVRALTVRLPIHVYAAVEALAKLSSTTKGAMVSNLTEAAADQISSNLSPERRAKFLELQGESLAQLLQDTEQDQEQTQMGEQK